jgi:hypothetical protein
MKATGDLELCRWPVLLAGAIAALTSACMARGPSTGGPGRSTAAVATGQATPSGTGEASLCPPLKQPPPRPDHRSDRLLFDVPARVNIPALISILADSRQPTRSPAHYEIEIITPTGQRRKIEFNHQNRVQVCPKCDPVVGDPDSCRNVRCYWNSRGAHRLRLPFDIIDEEGTYTLTLHRTGTGDRLTRTLEVGGDFARAACDKLPATIGDHKKERCGAAIVPIGGRLWGSRARYQWKGCRSNLFVAGLSAGVQVSFDRGPWGKATRLRLPEGRVRRHEIPEGVLSAYRTRDKIYFFATPHGVQGHDRLLRAFMRINPPVTAKPFKVPACIATDHHRTRAQTPTEITQKAHVYPKYVDNRVIGVVLSTITQGRFFERAGFRPGDTIYSYDGTHIDRLERVSEFIERLSRPGVVRVTLLRKDYKHLPQYPGGVRCLVIELD